MASTASDIFRRYKSRPGSSFIATEYAIRGLIKALHCHRPKRILEIGAGIGTTTATIIDVLDGIHGRGKYRFASIEPNEYCRRQLGDNLGENLASVQIASRYEDIDDDFMPFDFLLVDGGGPYAEDRPEADAPIVEQHCLYVSQLAPRALIFVENDRGAQRALMIAAINREFAHWHFLPFRRTGYHLYRLDPTSAESRSARFSEPWSKFVQRIRNIRVAIKQSRKRFKRWFRGIA